MALSVILTRAFAIAGVNIPPEGLLRVMLTRAQMQPGGKTAVILTRAQAFAGTGLPVDVDLGPPKFVPPFKQMSISAVVSTEGIDADAWTWTVVSSNPRAPMSTRFQVLTTTVEGDTLTYKAPAAVKGTTLTISATAHVTGRSDTTVSVVHEVRPHSWPWRINPDGKFYPVLRLPVEALMIKTAQVTVGTTATRLDVAPDDPYTTGQVVIIRVPAAGAQIMVGGSDVSSSNGFPVDPGEALELRLSPGDQLYGWKSSGTQLVYVLQNGV